MLRGSYLNKIQLAFQVQPVTVLLGPRQSGKTTLAHQYVEAHWQQVEKNSVHFFDLEDPNDFQLLQSPKSILAPLKGLVIIDEVQFLPDLFKLLRVLVDRPDNQTQFLILGSASFELSRQSSETLAGRVRFIEITPFSYEEFPEKTPEVLKNLWQRGGFPKSYLAKNDLISEGWREDYIRTFLERDIPSFGIKVAPQQIRRFWQMLTHYHAQTFNAAELARSMSISQPTCNHYIDILSATFMMRQLSPWFENIKKRQVKSRKVYFRDSGIYHSLLGIGSEQDLVKHPKLGASWEGFALEEIIRQHKAREEDCFYWATQSGAELDLLICQQGKKVGFEFKFNDAPQITKSMRIAMEDLKLDSLTIIYPGDKVIELEKNIYLCGLGKFYSMLS